MHSSGRCGIGGDGRHVAGGEAGTRNNTNCRSGKRAWLIDGVEPQRDWALMDDVSTAND